MSGQDDDLYGDDTSGFGHSGVNNGDDALSAEEANYDASYSVTVPSYFSPKIDRYYDYDNLVVDYEDFGQLTEATNEARKALFEITSKLNGAERKESETRTKYDRVWRRAYLSSTKKTDTAKKAEASMIAEDAEDDLLKYSQARSEYNRMSNAIRMELQTLQAVGNNFRQQMKMN